MSASQSGEWDRAARYWNQVFVETGETDAQACLEAAHALAELGEEERASSILQRGLREDPDHPDLLEKKGDVLVSLGFRRSAETAYEHCLEVDPGRISALCSLGCLRVRLNRESAAIAPLQAAVDAGCDDPEVLRKLAHAYEAADDPVRAWQLYERVIERGESRLETLIQASTLSTNERVREADPHAFEKGLQWLETAIRVDPRSAAAHFQRGVIAEELGQLEAAVVHYEEAIASDPKCVHAMTNLALVHLQLGDRERARALVSKAAGLEPNRARRRALESMLHSLRNSPGIDRPVAIPR